MLTITVQEHPNDKLPDQYKYSHIIDPKGGEAPSAFENYKRAKEVRQDDRKWQEAIRQALEDAMSDYFDKR